MASPKTLELNMKRQLLLKKNEARVLDPGPAVKGREPNRAMRRKMAYMAAHMPRKQGLALLKVAEDRGLVPRGTYDKAIGNGEIGPDDEATWNPDHVIIPPETSRFSLFSRGVFLLQNLPLWIKSSVESFMSRFR